MEEEEVIEWIDWGWMLRWVGANICISVVAYCLLRAWRVI